MVSLSVLSLRPHLLQVLYVLWGVTMTTLQVSPWRRLVRSVASNTTCCFLMNCLALLISLHIRSMWETTVMHKQVSGWTVNFGPNFPESPFLELKTRKPPSPFWKTSDLGWPKFTPEYPLPFQKTSDLGWPKFTPEYPPISENFRFGMTKVYSGIPPPPFRKTSDLGWPKFTPEYPPISENFRFGMTKVYSGIPPPISENFRFGMTKVYSGIPPPPRENCHRVQVRDFLNTEIYYMWRLYPTRITTSWWGESEEKKPPRSRERRLQYHVVSASLRYSHVLFSFICISGRTMRKPDYFVRSKLYFIFFQLQVPGPPFQFLCFEALKYGYLTWLFHIFSKYNFLWYTITFSYFKQFLILLCSAYLSFS